MTIFFVLAMLLQGRSGNDYMEKAAAVAETALSILADAASFGEELWDKLGNGQGVKILKEIETLTATLKAENKELLRERQESVDQRTQKEVDIAKQVAPLREKITKINNDLRDFDKEIDSTAPHASVNRGYMTESGGAKPSVLESVEKDWKMGRYKMAMDALSRGVGFLDELQTANTCLQDSITRKKAACDKDMKALPAN